MDDKELTADGNWCPDCGEPREACRCIPPVDRSKRCMLSGNPETPEHREIDPRTGMQKDRAATVLVREVRKGCDQVTQGAPIPEDLRGLYAQAVADKSGASTTRGFQFANIQRLIERIARLEAKNRELKAQLERMGKPVSNEEWGTLPWMNVRNPRYFMERKDVNALIAARASKEAHS